MKHAFIPPVLALALMAACTSSSLEAASMARKGVENPPVPAAKTEAGKDTVAVMDFSAINAPASEGAVLSEFVRSAVIQSGVFTVVDKKNMDKLLNEQAFQQTGCTSEECAVKLGRVLNVRKMIVGSYSLMGDTRFLTARLVDVETGKIEGSAKEKGFTPDNADTAAENLVSKLVGGGSDESSYQAPAQDEGIALGRKRRYAATTAEQPRARSQASDMKGYIMFFLGNGDATIKTFKEESLRVYGTIPTYKFSLNGELLMNQETAPVGFRAGGWGEYFGVDGEFSTQKFASKPSEVTLKGTSYDGYSYYPYGGSVTVPDGWLIEQPISIGMNIYLHATSKWVLQPYAGVGFAMAIDMISSRVIQAPSGEFLSEVGFGFTVKFPIGARLMLGDWFFLYGEYQPYFRFVDMTTTTYNPNYKDTFQVNGATTTVGMGFAF